CGSAAKRANRLLARADGAIEHAPIDLDFAGDGLRHREKSLAWHADQRWNRTELGQPFTWRNIDAEDALRECDPATAGFLERTHHAPRAVNAFVHELNIIVRHACAL